MKILVVQTSFLGDLVLSVPVISGIRKLYPTAEIWIMTTPQGASLIKRLPEISGVLTFDKRGAESGVLGILRKAKELRGYGFNRAYALQRSYRTSLTLALAGIPKRIGFKGASLSFLYHERAERDRGQHEVLRNLQLLAGELSLESAPTALKLVPPAIGEVSAALRDFIGAHGRYAVVVPGSVWATKRWSASGFRAVASNLLENGWRVATSGDQSERELCEVVGGGLGVSNFSGELSLEETMLLICKASLLICNDSMALHLGSAFKVPTVAVFCATSPTFGFGPWQNNARVVEKSGLSCKPCARHGGMVCPTGTEACMKELPPSAVLSAVKQIIGAS